MTGGVWVADLRRLRPGEPTVVTAGARAVALVLLDGTVFALDPVCPHEQGPLGLGEVADGILTCPFHGWGFDVRSGACVTIPGERVACHPIRVEGTDVYLDAEP